MFELTNILIVLVIILVIFFWKVIHSRINFQDDNIAKNKIEI